MYKPLIKYFEDIMLKLRKNNPSNEWISTDFEKLKELLTVLEN